MYGRMFCPYKTIMLKKGGLMLILESVIVVNVFGVGYMSSYDK